MWHRASEGGEDVITDLSGSLQVAARDAIPRVVLNIRSDNDGVARGTLVKQSVDWAGATTSFFGGLIWSCSFDLRRAGCCLVAGWCERRSSGSPLHHHLSLARPLGYFAALFRCEGIIAKRVTYIDHHVRDGYYRCLLGVFGPRLLEILSQGASEDCSDRWFNRCAIEDGDGSGEGVVDEHPAIEDGDPMPNLPEELPPAQVLPLVEGLWTRCIGRRPLYDDAGLFYDGASCGSGPQRGCALQRLGPGDTSIAMVIRARHTLSLR